MLRSLVCKVARRDSMPSICRRGLACLLAGMMCFVLITACGARQTKKDLGGTERSTQQESRQDQSAEAMGSEPVEISLVAVGDILQHAQVWQSGELEDGTRNYDHLFRHIAGELADKDVKIVNQETPMGGDELGFTGFPTFNGPQEVGDAEAAAGFNVVLKATNHVMDTGYEGLKNELAFWRGNHPEMTVVGARDPDDPSTSVNDVYVYEKDGFKVAILNYTFDLNGYEDPESAISLLEENHVCATMARASAAADMVVVLPHWGEEYQLEPVESQGTWADLFVKLGADVIIGGHPHVIEPVEPFVSLDGHIVPCFWSMGNFVSTSPDNESLVGGMAEVTLLRDEHGKCSVTRAAFVPVVTHLGVGEDMTTYPLYDWTDELAESNMRALDGYAVPENTTCTRAWADDFCAGVLGDDFHADSGIFELAI